MTDTKQNRIRLEAINGYELLVATHVPVEELMSAINACYTYICTDEEERAGLPIEELMGMTVTRMNEMSPEEAAYTTTRMIRMVIHRMMIAKYIVPTRTSIAAGWRWLKDQCRDLGIIMPKDRELVLSNIVLNFVLSTVQDQLYLFMMLLKNSGYTETADRAFATDAMSNTVNEAINILGLTNG